MCLLFPRCQLFQNLCLVCLYFFQLLPFAHSQCILTVQHSHGYGLSKVAIQSSPITNILVEATIALFLSRILCSIVVWMSRNEHLLLIVVSLNLKLPGKGWRRSIFSVASETSTSWPGQEIAVLSFSIKMLQSYVFKILDVDVRIAHRHFIVRSNMRTNIQDIPL